MATETVFIVNPASSNGKTGRRPRVHEGVLRRKLGFEALPKTVPILAE